MAGNEQRLLAQYHVAKALAESASLAEAAPIILKSVCEALGWEVGGLWLRDPALDLLRLAELWTSPTIDAVQFAAASRARVFVPGTGLVGRVFATGKPEWIVDVGTAPNFPRASAARAAGLHAGFAFPVRCDHSVLGVFDFFATSSLAPDELLLMVMDGIGSQIGQFDERRRAERELRVKAEELQRANQQLASKHEELLQAHLQLSSAHTELRTANERLATLASTDGLTGVANHRQFRDRVELMFAEARRGRSFSLLMIDLDDFKQLNDEYGHQAGDEFLIAVALSLSDRTRSIDLVSRYGGDEFTVLLADADESSALKVAEELRLRVRNIPCRLKPMSVSIGATTCGPHHASATDLVALADAAMYSAKRAGGDRVVVAPEPARQVG